MPLAEKIQKESTQRKNEHVWKKVTKFSCKNIIRVCDTKFASKHPFKGVRLGKSGKSRVPTDPIRISHVDKLHRRKPIKRRGLSQANLFNVLSPFDVFKSSSKRDKEKNDAGSRKDLKESTPKFTLASFRTATEKLLQEAGSEVLASRSLEEFALESDHNPQLSGASDVTTLQQKSLSSTNLLSDSCKLKKVIAELISSQKACKWGGSDLRSVSDPRNTQTCRRASEDRCSTPFTSSKRCKDGRQGRSVHLVSAVTVTKVVFGRNDLELTPRSLGASFKVLGCESLNKIASNVSSTQEESRSYDSTSKEKNCTSWMTHGLVLRYPQSLARDGSHRNGDTVKDNSNKNNAIDVARTHDLREGDFQQEMLSRIPTLNSIYSTPRGTRKEAAFSVDPDSNCIPSLIEILSLSNTVSDRAILSCESSCVLWACKQDENDAENSEFQHFSAYYLKHIQLTQGCWCNSHYDVSNEANQRSENGHAWSRSRFLDSSKLRLEVLATLHLPVFGTRMAAASATSPSHKSLCKLKAIEGDGLLGGRLDSSRTTSQNES